MEADIIDKQERLDRMKRRAMAWETSRRSGKSISRQHDGVIGRIGGV